MVTRMRGFTLLELMIVVAILGVLMAMAMPAVSEMIASQRVRDTAADIHTSMMRARNEAISRGLATAVTPVGGNWAGGWYIANPDGTYNPDMTNPTVFIEQHAAVPNATITSTGGTASFSHVGRLTGVVKITIGGGGGTALIRCVEVDLMGRPKTYSGACV